MKSESRSGDGVSVCVCMSLCAHVSVCMSSFVRFTTSESREKAMQEANMNGFTYNGAKLFVRMPK